MQQFTREQDEGEREREKEVDVDKVRSLVDYNVCLKDFCSALKQLEADEVTCVTNNLSSESTTSTS